MSVNMELTTERLLTYLRPTKTWPLPPDRAQTIVDLQSFVSSGALSDELVQELFSDIPAHIFSVIARRHLVGGIENATDWYVFLERLCNLIGVSELPSLQDLKNSKLFRMIQKDARERMRKADWPLAMTKRLTENLGTNWEKDLDPSMYTPKVGLSFC
jgi:hypothetical protein